MLIQSRCRGFPPGVSFFFWVLDDTANCKVGVELCDEHGNTWGELGAELKNTSIENGLIIRVR